jgi:hypothetical protein
MSTFALDYPCRLMGSSLTLIIARANPGCPVELLTSNTPVESLSITQLSTTAHTLPGIVHAVGQPDLHPGTKFPIGAVIASKGRSIHL